MRITTTKEIIANIETNLISSTIEIYILSPIYLSVYIPAKGLCLLYLHYFYTFYTPASIVTYTHKKPQKVIRFFCDIDPLGMMGKRYFLYYFNAKRCASSVLAPCVENTFLLMADLRLVIR